MFRKRVAICASISAGSYLLLSAPHHARRFKEVEAQKIQRTRLPPKQSPVKRPESTLYSPLIEEQNQIRLLTIRGESPLDPLRCDLDVVSLDDNPNYTALSYTWGEPIKRNHPLWSFKGLYAFLCGLYRRLFRSPRIVFVNDEPFKVTDNLYSAMAQFRRDQHALPLWIDQICINQDDHDEKSSQVGLMSTIYDKAQRTYIWLGPSADDSDAAMDFIGTASTLANRDLDSVSVPWSSLRDLLARSWWERIWVVQEMFLSRQVRVKCGTKEVDLADFVALTDLSAFGDSDRQFSPPSDAPKQPGLMSRNFPFNGLLRLWGQRHMLESRHRSLWLDDMLLSAAIGREAGFFEKAAGMPERDLWLWAYHTQHFQSTMRRDKILALLGISKGEDRESVEISYPENGSSPITVAEGDSKVFTEAAAWIMRSMRNLDVIQLSRPESKALSLLPSWVPDFSTAAPGGIDALLASYKADGGPQAWSKLTPEDIVEEKYYEYTPTQSLDWAERRLLWILPVQLLLLRWPRAPARWMSVAVPIQGAWFGSDLLQGWAEYGMKTRPAYGAGPAVSDDGKRIILSGIAVDKIKVVDPAPDVGLADGRQSPRELERQRKELTKLLARWERLALTYAANPYGDKRGGREEAFWRVVATNGLRKQGLNLVYPSAIATKYFPWGESYRGFTAKSSLAALSQHLNKKEMDHVGTYGDAVLRATASRAFLITRSGLLCLGPQSTEPDDLLCIMRGGRAPFILRMGGDGTYRYVGDCYVQGLMAGEYFAGAVDRRGEVKTFELL